MSSHISLMTLSKVRWNLVDSRIQIEGRGKFIISFHIPIKGQYPYSSKIR